jgi:hypothetical protein
VPSGIAERIKSSGISFVVGMVSLAGGCVLLASEWTLPGWSESTFWNGIVAFTALGIAADAFFLPVSRVPFANLTSSVAYVPLLAAVPLFGHPWPMLISGVTAATADMLRRKPAVRVWFNTVQYMLAVGLGGVVYRALGGEVSLTQLSIEPLPFIGLVETFIVVNTGSVALVVALSSGVSVRESWSRIIGPSWLYDSLAGGLAVLLVFMYHELEYAGLAILTVPLFLVRHTRQMYLELERANRELLEVMVKAIEARDPYTSGHSVRVAEYARTLARELGLAAKQVDQIGTAALLHDVGKIYEEFAPLLRNQGRLSPEERLLMQAHPVRSADLVAIIAEFRGPVQVSIRNHHENFDGSGYPDGLMGEQIPLGARIIMIADTLDAMTTDRPYRRALPYRLALEELKQYSGKQFDPALVTLAVRSPGIRRLLGSDLGERGLTAVEGGPSSRGNKSSGMKVSV